MHAGHKPRIRFCFVSLLTVVFFAGASAGAQDKTAEIEKIFDWAKPDNPGCTVAISHNGKVVFNRAYGVADLERNVPISTRTVFDIGSITKQFVAAAILILVEEGQFTLTDDIRTIIPELPDYGHTVTIDHLLTHTGGIRDWTGIANLSSRRDDTLILILRQRGLDFVPGEEWRYSNSGYVLLREAIKRKSGMSVSDFMRKRLFEPLEMRSTTFSNDMNELIPNRALAYDKKSGHWKLSMLEHDRGGGGVFSTASDLLLWNDP